MRKIIVLDEGEDLLDNTSYHEADLVLRKRVLVEYAVIKNRFGPPGRVINNLGDLDIEI